MDREDAVPRRGRVWDWFFALLVLLLVQVSALRLVMTDWVPDLYFAETLGALGVILGLALGSSLFNVRAVFFLAVAYTGSLVPWHLSTAIELEGPLLERLASLAGRVLFSAGQLARGGAVEDTLFFVASTSLLYWFLGLFAGYQLTRHGNGLAVVLPSAIVTLIIHSYDDYVPLRVLPVAGYLLLALVLLGRLQFSRTASNSKARGILVTNEAPLDIQYHLLVLTSIVIVVVWILPGPIPRVETAAQWWNRATNPMRADFTNAVSALESPYGSGRIGDFYTETAELGRSAVLGDETVLRARINSSMVNSPPRYYWRGWAYDRYIDGQWTSTSSALSPFDPETDEVRYPPYEGRTVISATITMHIARQKLLYTPAEPFWVNRPGDIRTGRVNEETQDLRAWTASPALAAGDRYEVRSRLANPTVEDLLAAGTDYPSWVQERYLQVPEDLEPRLKEIAEDATAGRATAYEQAAAVTDYLRQEIDYSTTAPDSPVGIDPIVWLLSNSKRGYCTYYASAEVLLLRSLGVPSRLAVGFAQGDLENGAYTVLRHDAHAWPEVFFPGIGWVEFEPTVNQAPLVRRTSAPPETTEGGLTGAPPLIQESDAGFERAEDVFAGQPPTLVSFISTPLGRLLAAGAAVVVLAFVFYAGSHRGYFDRLGLRLARGYDAGGRPMPGWLAHWAAWAALTPAERAFQAINLGLWVLGEAAPLHATPAERARRLTTLIPSADSEIRAVCTSLQSTLFSREGSPLGRAVVPALRILTQVGLERLRRPLRGGERRYN